MLVGRCSRAGAEAAPTNASRARRSIIEAVVVAHTLTDKIVVYGVFCVLLVAVVVAAVAAWSSGRGAGAGIQTPDDVVPGRTVQEP